jgi:hypothetical protein
MSDARPRNSARLIRARGHGQAIVEFGLVALLFTLLLMGAVDFAILLNGWLGVSSSARDVARVIAVGACTPTGVAGFASSRCRSGGGLTPNAPCTPAAADCVQARLQITGVDYAGLGPGAVTYTVTVCSPDLSTCSPSPPGTCSSPAAFTCSNLSNIYPGGRCDPQTLLDNASNPCPTPIHPQPGDAIVLTLTAQIQVVTPLVRPFFGCAGWWISVFKDDKGVTHGNPPYTPGDPSNPRCDVPIASRTVARYEGLWI